jgi:predicted RND superfamily exporter protein
MALKTVFEQKVADAIIKWRWIVIGITIIATVVFIYGVSILKFKVALEDMLPPANPFVKLNTEFGHRFGGLTSFAVEVGVEKEGDLFTPKRLEILFAITDDIYFLNSVRRDLVWSITMNKAKEIRGATGDVFINAFLYPHPPTTTDGCLEVKNKVLSSPLFAGRLVTMDGKHALITGNLKEDASDKEFFENLLRIKEKYQGREGMNIQMIGRPVLMGWIYHYMPDMLIIFAISLLVIAAMLSMSFKAVQGPVVPVIIHLSIGTFAAVWGLGFIGITGMNLNPLMVVLPFAIGIRGISHSIQITSRFLEEYARSEDRMVAAHTTVGAMFIPNISAIAAECSAFMFLVAVKITMVQQLAIAITFWMFAIFFTTAVLTPILCMFLPKPHARHVEQIKKSWKTVASGGTGDILDKLIIVTSRFFIGRGKLFAIGAMVVIIFGGAFLAQHVKSGDLSPGSPILYPSSDYNRACDSINKRFSNAGTDALQIYFDGKGTSGAAFAPPVLQTAERLHKVFTAAMPDTYSGWDSAVPIVKTMNMEMHEGDVKWDFIPDNPQLLGTVLSIYLAKLIPEDFNKYTDAETHSLGNINYYFKDHMPDTVDTAIETTRKFFKNLDLDTSSLGEFKMAGGEIGINYAINHEIESVHYIIIFGVLSLIFIICAFSFRSITAGVLLVIPLIASNVVAFSYMALNDIGLTINTLPVISVGLGIGVDFGVYLYARFQEEYKNFGDYDMAVLTGCVTAGKGVVYTALTMVVPLYLWYFVSDIRFQGEMGLFLAIILTVNLMAVMFFHPAIISKLRPKFITKMTME